VSVELRVLCEGQTERGFVTAVLAPHLGPFGVYPRGESLVPRGFGVVPFKVLRSAIKRDVGTLRRHQYVTTMVDLYALADYPGEQRQPGDSVLDRVARIESAMKDGLPSPQFIPYIQIHEFEALVFVDLDVLPSQFPDGEADGAPERLRREVGGAPPESIDDGKETAPSKRLIRAIPAYEHQKAIVGPNVTAKIGMRRLMDACPHFADWIRRLERLAKDH
jgi:hypothetical protein